MPYIVSHFTRDENEFNAGPFFQEEIQDEDVPEEIVRLFDSGLIHKVRLVLVGTIDAVWEKKIT